MQRVMFKKLHKIFYSLLHLKKTEYPFPYLERLLAYIIKMSSLKLSYIILKVFKRYYLYSTLTIFNKTLHIMLMFNIVPTKIWKLHYWRYQYKIGIGKLMFPPCTANFFLINEVFDCFLAIMSSRTSQLFPFFSAVYLYPSH